MALRPADELLSAGAEVRDREAARLGPLLPGSEVVLTGGSSLSGAVTGGDIDLHLRVRGDFPRAVTVLSGLYDVVKPEIWQPTLATFRVPDVLPVGIAATPVGSQHDRRFTRCWQLLAGRPELLEQYNELKRTHHGRAGYEVEKSTFFSQLENLP